ncbi:MAG: ComF family protein [Candidatus Sulfotelmatobacter sp.]
MERTIIAAPAAAGSREAVFSSSEDQIRVGHVAVNGPSIASVKTSTSRTNWFSRAAEGLFSVLFPSDCRICDLPLLNISRLPVCPDCIDEIHPIAGKVCSICGERVLSAYAEHDLDGLLQCPVCRRIDRPFERAVAYGSYDGGLRELIHLLKFNGVRPAATVLGRMLADTFEALEPQLAPGTTLVIPVPLYKGKRRQRGFNQAEMVVRSALKAYPARDRFQLAADILLRTRETHSQIGLTSHQRRENLRGAFAVARAPEIAGREVLLVDDVYTTGTTASECARVLRRAGASKVWVATVARTLKLASNQEKGFKVSTLQRFEDPESARALAS